jgi:signal transduction histidine kinase
VRESAASAALGQDEVTITAVTQESLPAVRGDRERLRQLLLNLIENAVKYSSAGGQVRVHASAHDDVVEVDVSDDGPGIAREHQGLIFERFGRVQDGSAKPGTGLGLFIARSIAEAHGGSVEVRSAPQRGATFTVTLPVHTEERRPRARVAA